MEIEKMVRLRKKLSAEEKVRFDSAYDELKRIFMAQVSGVSEVIKNGKFDIGDLRNGFNAAKVINNLGKKYQVEVKVPEEDEYLLLMYTLKFGNDILNQKKAQPKAI